jgi:hypothetical protein
VPPTETPVVEPAIEKSSTDNAPGSGNM